MRNLKKVVLAMLTALMVVGCSSSKAVEIDVQAAVDGIVAENFAEMSSMPYDATYVETWYGLTEEQYESFAGVVPMISIVPIEIAAFEAKEGKVEEVKAAVEAYKTTKAEDSFYPVNQEAAMNAVVYVNGNYVFFLMAEDNTGAEAYVKSLFGE